MEKDHAGSDGGVPIKLAPMESLLVDELPASGSWQFVPKWDGFRCLAFRDGPEIELRSKPRRHWLDFPLVVATNLLMAPARGTSALQ